MLVIIIILLVIWVMLADVVEKKELSASTVKCKPQQEKMQNVSSSDV